MNITALAANPWFTVVLAIGLASGGFYMGQKYADNQCIAASTASTVASTEDNAELAALRLANAEYEKRAIDAEKNVEANKRLAAQRIAEAEAANKRAAVAQRTLITKEQEWKRKFSDAMSEPKCAELMALQVCEAAPMPSQR